MVTLNYSFCTSIFVSTDCLDLFFLEFIIVDHHFWASHCAKRVETLLLELVTEEGRGRYRSHSVFSRYTLIQFSFFFFEFSL